MMDDVLVHAVSRKEHNNISRRVLRSIEKVRASGGQA